MFEFSRIAGRPLGLLLLVGSWAGAVNASSLVDVNEPQAGATPSILTLSQTPRPVDVVYLPALATDPNVAIGEVDPAPPHHDDPASSSIMPLSRSVVAVGEPDVTDEEVAAIGDKPWHRESIPMVIRGGVIGDAFSTPAPPAAPETPKASDEQASETAQSPDGSSEPEQAAPPPAQTTASPYSAQPQ